MTENNNGGPAFPVSVPASVEITDMKLGWWSDLIDLPAKIVDRFYEDEELLEMLMQDWTDDEINAAEARAESRAEED